MKKPKPKPKKCQSCGESFIPWQIGQKACSINCAIKIAKTEQDKAYRKETKRLKDKIKTRSEWLKEAQAVFNRYVRLRDERYPCISCGRHHQGQYHAGHYLSVGACPELRFHPYNNNKQCAPCNNHLSGNAVKYRIALIAKIGLKNVEWLEGPHSAQKLTIDDIKEIKAYYNELIKEIA